MFNFIPGTMKNRMWMSKLNEHAGQEGGMEGFFIIDSFECIWHVSELKKSLKKNQNFPVHSHFLNLVEHVQPLRSTQKLTPTSNNGVTG